MHPAPPPEPGVFTGNTQSIKFLTLCITLLKPEIGPAPGIPVSGGQGRMVGFALRLACQAVWRAARWPGPASRAGRPAPARCAPHEVVHLTTGRPTEVIHNCGDRRHCADRMREIRLLWRSVPQSPHELQSCNLPTVWISPVENFRRRGRHGSAGTRAQPPSTVASRAKGGG